MRNMLAHFAIRLFALAFFIALLFPAPSRALDLSLDGQLRGQCGTASATSGAATLNNKCGTITTEALVAPAASEYTLTLTNSAIAAADIPLVTVGNGSNTTGLAGLMRVTPAAGSVVIVVRQMTTASFNGTLAVKYFNVKP